ncbi:C2H2 finger domain-containing protein [Colletotrichum lupini]|uniref:C2H2 finger domain-containing protein n=1 Tax=Colletotrichum lupini TaxID=145971 RepID=A0A9Q8WC73_9PEZI|nr:C2H2 finger domain-containing protein [Colletotrichum lupini]UQC77422.1 C2H2 finger domain-containing protein [Colletotrichum lupini]
MVQSQNIATICVGTSATNPSPLYSRSSAPPSATDQSRTMSCTAGYNPRYLSHTTSNVELLSLFSFTISALHSLFPELLQTAKTAAISQTMAPSSYYINRNRRLVQVDVPFECIATAFPFISRMSPRRRRNTITPDSDASFPLDKDSCGVSNGVSHASDQRAGLDTLPIGVEAFHDDDDGKTLYDGDGDDDDDDDDEILSEDKDYDMEDQMKLFDGNVHPSEYWLRELESFNEDSFACQDYSLGTTVLLDAVEGQWHQFCAVIKRDVQQCYATISTSIMHTFFDWLLNQKVGKDGRRKRGIKKKSSLGTYWKVFRLVYERAVGDKLDLKLNRSMHREGNSPGPKPVLQLTSPGSATLIEEQNETTLSIIKKSFKLRELRILAVLFLLLLAPVGSRPMATLNLRFKDIRVALARDPEGGLHKLLLWLTPEFTKTYLGEKEQKTYTIPETMFDPSLLLSPHVFLLGIIFRYRAFCAPSLTSPHHLQSLDIHPGEKELPLPLREDLNQTFIFRRAVETLTGYQMSRNQRISYGMMAAWVKRIGEIMGLKDPTIAYNLRYNAANVFDQIDVSEALRNLAMGHGNSDPFQRHYLGRNISAGLWGIRRLIDLTVGQSASVATHSTIRALMEAIPKLPLGSKEYKEAKRMMRKEKERLRRDLKQQIRDEWTDQQATDDIERRIRGVGFAKPATMDPCHPQRPAQKRLLAKLTAPVVTTLEGQYRRRDDAIEAVSAYCLVQEGCYPRESTPLYEATLSVFVADKEERLRRCFVCIGQALCLPTDDEQRLNELMHEFYTSNDLTKHFKRKHLDKIAGCDQVDCKVCDMTLNNKMHFQRHARDIHGTQTSTYAGTSLKFERIGRRHDRMQCLMPSAITWNKVTSVSRHFKCVPGHMLRRDVSPPQEHGLGNKYHN